MKTTIHIFLALLFFGTSVFSQPSFQASLIEGTVNVQRAQKKSWESLALGDKLYDNDIIETFFQTKVILQYGEENAVVLGSNTRILLNIRERDDKGLDINTTLFSGGVLIKAIGKSKANIYTANAVSEIDSGVVSAVVEAKTGHTGFQVLNGSAKARNIAQQQGKKLNTGLTTIVLPGKEPTAPLYITYRHVAVLKHFFGDEFIDREIEAAGIEPTEDRTSANRLSLSQQLQQDKSEADLRMHKRLFSQDKIWGHILEDRNKKRSFFKPLKRSNRLYEGRGELAFLSSVGIAGGQAFPYFELVPSFFVGNFSFGLTIPFARDYEGKVSMHFNSLEGVFDKIHHLTFGTESDQRYFCLGPIKEYTLGKGLVVDNYTNKSVYSVTQPLGIKSRFAADLFDINFFISDVSNWLVGGLQGNLYPGMAWIGAGYYYDANQYNKNLNNKNSRFIDFSSILDAPSVPNQSTVSSHAHVYELGLGLQIPVLEHSMVEVLVQTARKIGSGGGDGWIFHGPDIGVQIRNINFGLCYIVENGRLVSGHFGSTYWSNRLMFEELEDDTIQYWTQVNTLSKNRRAFGFKTYIRAKPFKGSAVDFTIKHDFLNRKPFMRLDNGEYIVDTFNIKNNFDFSLSFSINKELFKYINFATLYLSQENGGYYPKGGTYFASWGFNTGFDVLTAPLFFNLAFEAGLNFSYVDIYDERGMFGLPSNNVDNGDNILEIYVGTRWGFM